MLDYIITTSLCLLAFLVFHKLFLEKNKLHLFKRFFLLASVLLAAIIPLITFTTYVRMPGTNFSEATSTANSALANAATPFPWLALIGIIYFIGLSFFLYRFFGNLNSIISEINSNSTLKKGNFNLVLLERDCIPHSFLNSIFVSKSDYENNEISSSVIFHEEIHIRQKHSWDILFVEFLQCLLWFNPLLIWLKKEIQMNHEYMADRAVLEAGFEAKEYQTELLKFSKLGPSPSLSHSFHFKPLKKRLQQMKNQNPKNSSKILGKLGIVLLIPLVTSLIMAFSSNSYVFYVENISEVEPGKKPTYVEISLYNRLAKYYADTKEANLVIQKDEVDYMKLIYSNMTDDQKKNAEPFPKLPEILPYEINAVELVRDTPHDPPRPPWRVIDLQYEKDYTLYLNKVETSYEDILKATLNPPFPVVIQQDKFNSKFFVYTDGTNPGC